MNLCRRIFRNQRGSAIPATILVLTLLTMAGIYLASQSKNIDKNKRFMTTKTDEARALSLISALVLSPPHCNANFRLLPTTGDLTGYLMECASGFNCNPTGAKINKMQIGGGSWDPNLTGISPFMRIHRISYTTAAPAGPDLPSLLTLTVTLEKRVDSNSSSTIKITERLDAFVVRRIATPLQIAACAKSPNTSTTY